LASPAGQFAAIYSGNLVASQGADPAAALFHSFGWFIHSGLAERFSRSLIGFPFYLRRPHSPTLVPTWRSPLLAANGGRPVARPPEPLRPSANILQMSAVKEGDLAATESAPPPSRPRTESGIVPTEKKAGESATAPLQPDPAFDLEPDSQGPHSQSRVDSALEVFVPSGETLEVKLALKRLSFLTADSGANERVEVLQRALLTQAPETVLDRIASLAEQAKRKRPASLLTVRILQAFLLTGVSPSLAQIHQTLKRIQNSAFPQSDNDQEEWRTLASWLQDSWLDNSWGDNMMPANAKGMPPLIEDFEVGLEHLCHLPSPLPLVDDLLEFSLSPEMSNPREHRVMGKFASILVLHEPEDPSPLGRFMTTYHLVNRLAETGHLATARRISKWAYDGTVAWEDGGPTDLAFFLRRRLFLQQQALLHALFVLQHPAEVQRLRRFSQSFIGSHLPKPWPVIRGLREKAQTFLGTPQDEEGRKLLAAAANLFDSFVLEPLSVHFMKDGTSLIPAQHKLLQIAEMQPWRAYHQWHAPFLQLFDYLTQIPDWEGAYRLSDAFHRLGFLDGGYRSSFVTYKIIPLANTLDEYRAIMDSRLSPYLGRLADFGNRFVDLEPLDF
jgi:hypothetical protein